MNCPACGATNPDGAEWCLQCFTEFDPEPEEEADGPRPALAARDRDRPAGRTDRPATGTAADGGGGQAPGTADERLEPPASALATADGRFRRQGGAMDWQCPDCARWNPLERTTCEACGAALTDLFGPPGDEQQAAPAEADPTVVRVATALLPGAGHVMLDRPGTGIARAAVYVLWLAGGILLLLQARASGGPAVAAAPLLLGAVGLWGATQLDARALLAGRPDDAQLLTPRVFLWLVVGVVGLLLLAFVAAALSLPAR